MVYGSTDWQNYMRQALAAEAWHNRVVALAVKHGVTMIHDEILFDSFEQFEAFQAELAGLEAA